MDRKRWGDKNTVSKYGGKDKLEVYENVIEGNQMTKEKARKLVITADDPGMGKTTTLVIKILITNF